MSTKTRLTVTLDPELVEAGAAAVEAGRADSLSAWINSALADRVERDKKLQALGAAIATYESEFGAIGTDELAAQRRADRATARVVRPGPRKARRRRTGAA